MLLEDIYEVELEVGNHYARLDPPYVSKLGNELYNHWTMFVRPSDPKVNDCDLIDFVEFKLHISYWPRHLHKIAPGQAKDKSAVPNLPAARADEINVSGRAWACFDVPTTIHWKKELKRPPDHIEHVLKFWEQGLWKTYYFQLSKKDVNKVRFQFKGKNQKK